MPYFISKYSCNKAVYKYEDLLRCQDYDETLLSAQLEEIAIKAEQAKDEKDLYKKVMLYSRPNTRIETKDIQSIQMYDDIYAILRRSPGIQLLSPRVGGTKHSVILRGQTKTIEGGNDGANFMVNGGFVSQQSVEDIRPADIAFIDIVSGLNQLAIYVNQGVNGIVAIYLKTTATVKKTKQITDPNLLSRNIKAYHIAKPFIDKDYSNETKDKYDSRITIYWNPDFYIDKSGNS